MAIGRSTCIKNASQIYKRALSPEFTEKDNFKEKKIKVTICSGRFSSSKEHALVINFECALLL